MHVTPDVDEITVVAEYTTPVKNIESLVESLSSVMSGKLFIGWAPMVRDSSFSKNLLSYLTIVLH